MPCPFPGMDPYLERPAIWPDFHDSFIAFLRGALQPLIRPKYAALTQDRLYVVESQRPILPDVGIVRTRFTGLTTAATSVLEPDPATVFEIVEEEVRQTYLEIIEPASRDRVVTAIEVLSPTNKTAGEGRDSYLRKRQEWWEARTNVVEIDLLRTGAATVRVSEARLRDLHPWHYVVAVTRRRPGLEEVYTVKLQDRLPRIGVPLLPRDNDAVVDLQAVFTRCWDEGAYPEILDYDLPPPGKLTNEEIAWCEKLAKDYLSESGLTLRG